MGQNGRQVREIILNLAEQLQKYKIINESLKDEILALKTQVYESLEKYGQKIILAIDGLDEVEESAQDMVWFPKNLPSNVRIIATSRPGVSWENLNLYKNLEKITLEPLNDDEISQIIKNHVATYKLNIDKSDQDILRKRAAGNPLFLKVALEEIGETGIAVGQLATSIDRLFNQILERLSNKHGEHIVTYYLGLIAASRLGLSEIEIREIILGGIYDESLLIEVMLSFENFIIKRGQNFSFFHPEFDRTIKQRLGRGEIRKYHKKLAEYFGSKGFLYPRTLWEICYQSQWGEDYEKTLSLLSNLDFLESKCKIGMVDS